MDPLDVSWRYFRGFQRETAFQLPAITLFIGRNNVGKSSGYAPLLLLRQTLNARDSKTALLSRGEMLDVGSYRDFVHRHDLSKKIQFRVGLSESGWRPARRRAHGENSPAAVEMTFDSPDGGAARLYRHSLLDPDNRSIVTRTRERDEDTFSIVSRMLPAATSVGRPLKEVTELRSGLRNEEPDGFGFRGVGGLLVPRRWRENEERWHKVRDWFNAASDLFDVYQDANVRLNTWLSSISYLGPLRSLPQRTYRLAAEHPSDVGRDGQHAPELLFRGRDAQLREQTEHWLELLGYGSLDFEQLGEDYFQVFLRARDGLKVNIAHSGIGLSQLLPLLVQGLTAPRGGLLIAQQPEIHLNPAQQCLLTDFLVERGSQGRRVLVETHSEHVLLRLRRRIAEGEIDADDVAVYYFDSKGGNTVVERVPVGESGAIDREDWPAGFFEEQLTDSFALALAQSRASRA